MAVKSSNRSTKRGRAAGTKRRKQSSKPSQKRRSSDTSTATARDPASQRFVNDLLIRGEAVKPDRKGKVARNATHAIKQEYPDGSVEVKRVRLKTF